MKVFSVGPVQMHDRTYKVKQRPIPYFRTSDFSNCVLETESLLKKAMKAQEDSRAIFLTCSGTGGMEATVINCFDSNDKVLVIYGGDFGERFVHICEVNNIPFEALVLEHGKELTADMFTPYENKGFTGLLVNLDETSLCHLYDINIISDFCKRNGLFLVVDAISTFLCDDYEMAKWGIDASIVTSNKGLSVSPGVACIVLSKRIIDERVMKIRTRSLYFDFKEYLSNGARGQTPFTPAIGTIFEINDILHYIDEVGVDNVVKKVADNAAYFRKEIVKLNCTYPNTYKLSNIATIVRLPKPVGRELFNYLKEKYDYYINLSGSDKTNHTVRVVHAGDLNISDFKDLIQKINEFLNQQ